MNDTSGCYSYKDIDEYRCGYCNKYKVITNPSQYSMICDCSLEMNMIDGLNSNFDMCMNEYEMEMKSAIESIKNGSEKTVLSVFSNSMQQINTDDFVIFDSHNAVLGDCYHDLGSSALWIWEPGFYFFQYSLFCVEPSQFSVMKNDNMIAPGSTIGSLSGSTNMNHTFVIEIKAEDFSVSTGLPIPLYACKLQIVNNTQTTSNVILPDYGSSSNNLPQITSSVNIFRL